MKPPPFVRRRRQAAGEQVPFVLAQTANVSYPVEDSGDFFFHSERLIGIDLFVEPELRDRDGR